MTAAIAIYCDVGERGKGFCETNFLEGNGEALPPIACIAAAGNQDEEASKQEQAEVGEAPSRPARRLEENATTGMMPKGPQFPAEQEEERRWQPIDDLA